MTMDNQIFYRRRLPHYQPPGATLFVTFRLAGSIPQAIIQQLLKESKAKEAEILRITEQSAHREAIIAARKVIFARWDRVLDGMQQSPHWLADPTIANLVCEAMHYLDRRKYDLEAYCVMPNHVHLVFTPRLDHDDYYSLASILKSLKGFTARKANEILSREGEFWQPESYDHVIRDDQEFERIVNYVLSNPERAGLPAEYVYRRPPYI